MKAPDELRIGSAQRVKVGQNAKYDMQVLANRGVRLAGVQHDTLLQSVQGLLLMFQAVAILLVALILMVAGAGN